ncbi:MAG: hypothetical protein JWP49_2544 [Phenylobacterium sp.]|nr:hypothetical protein [Phenylobacterium sp.]
MGWMRRVGLAAGAAGWVLALGAQAGEYRAPRTPDGRPDLGGLWDNGSYTKLQRPKELKGGLVPDPAAAKAWSEKVAKHRGVNVGPEDTIGQNDSEFPESGDGLARIRGQLRSSWIVSPADGRVPLSPAGKVLNEAKGTYDNPEERPGLERCVTSAGSSAPLLSAQDANVFQFLLTRDHFVVVSEKNHDVRIIPIGAAGPAKAPPTWTGNSVGRWEGETLVVETDGFRGAPMVRVLGVLQSPASRVVERFSRTAADEILYEFSVTDPTVYAQTWRAEMLFKATKGPQYEYACHEGNYSIVSILAAARQGHQTDDAKPAAAPAVAVAAAGK